METFRGHAIRLLDAGPDSGRYVYSDTGELVSETWRDRPCGKCNEHNTPDGHDACIGKIYGVMNACCGHGDARDAYAVMTDGESLRCEDAIHFFDQINKERTQRKAVNK